MLISILDFAYKISLTLHPYAKCCMQAAILMRTLFSAILRICDWKSSLFEGHIILFFIGLLICKFIKCEPIYIAHEERNLHFSFSLLKIVVAELQRQSWYLMLRYVNMENSGVARNLSWGVQMPHCPPLATLLMGNINLAKKDQNVLNLRANNLLSLTAHVCPTSSTFWRKVKEYLFVKTTLIRIDNWLVLF